MTDDVMRLTLARDRHRDDLRRLVRAGQLERVRLGSYGTPIRSDDFEAKRDRAVRRMVAVCDRLSTDFCLSHESGALLWQWPLVRIPSATHITQGVNARARGASDVVRHRLSLPTEDRDQRHGLPVTSRERTALDCARSFTPLAAVILLDAALRDGVEREALIHRLALMGGQRGIRLAREALDLADPRSESPGESVTRFRIHQAGLPAPVPQVEVHTRLGLFRMDMAWPELMVGLEYDGLVKYTRFAAGDPTAVVLAEKRRQEAIEQAGWRVVRINRADVRDAQSLRGILGPLLCAERAETGRLR